MASNRSSAMGHRALGDFKADRRLLLLVAMALVVGSAGAFAAWALLKLIALVTNLVWFSRWDAGSVSLAHAPRTPWMVAAPALGGVVVGLMARFGSDKIRGHGIPEAIEAILIGGSRLSPKVALLKPLSSAVAIGTGGPFGAEGPIIMTGGALGSLFAQCFQLSAAERKTLLVAGAAAGMTGIFGTPLASVLLAVELLLFEWRPRSFIPVAASVAAAVCWRPLLFGAGPLFPASTVLPAAWWVLPVATGIGAVVGLLSSALTIGLYRLEDGFERLAIHWMWWPALGGVVVGLGGLVDPRALGVGYGVIGDLLSGHMVVQAVLAILLVKAVIWLAALSSGTSGGVLAPLLIIGGAAGWLIGHLLPDAPGVWALVGMAAMLGGTLPAPLTGAAFAVELTGNLSVLPAVLTAATASYALAVLLMRRSILTEKIARRGQHITREYAIDPYELARVNEVMAREVDTLPADLPLAEAVAVLAQGRHRIYPVVDGQGRPVGLASRADALRWSLKETLADAGALGERVSDAELAIVHPSDTAAWAAQVMLDTGQGRLPVADPDTGVLVGLLSRKDLLEVRARTAHAEAHREAFFRPGRRKMRQAVAAASITTP